MLLLVTAQSICNRLSVDLGDCGLKISTWHVYSKSTSCPSISIPLPNTIRFYSCLYSSPSFPSTVSSFSFTFMYLLLSLSLPHPPVTGFSFYQWFCFQETEEIFDRFNPFDNSTTVLEFLNSTDTLSGQICVQTETFRQWVDTRLPWFKYQEETWLAIGESAMTRGRWTESICVGYLQSTRNYIELS